ncbi:limbin isoform X2 [Colius striatus]|uniref:limbin isoform X2 n=1 Tax=Colius striatus TaxID=57412 RepID=UPI002B1D2E8F|nr:limbin isoform X2 [Colius striatus]
MRRLRPGLDRGQLLQSAAALCAPSEGSPAAMWPPLAGLLLALLSCRPLRAVGGRPLPSPAEGAGAPGLPPERCGQTAAGVIRENLELQKEKGCLGMTVPLPLLIQANEAPHQLLTSAASDDQWSHSVFTLIPSWTKKILFRRESSVNHQLPEDVSSMSVSSEFGITFQKCGVVDAEHDPQTAYITLLINNTNTLLSTNITDLTLLDNITGLHVEKSNGNKTTDGIQIYGKGFLQGGEHFTINYSALLDGKEMWDGRVLILPAKLTFRSSSQNKTHLVSLTALFTITEEEKTKSLSNHAIHASGFFIAFFVSLVLTCALFFIVYRTQISKWSFCSQNQEIQHELGQNHKLEHSQFTSGDLFSEDIIMSDQIIDILSFEESGNMLQALEDLEIASLTRADADLEAYRMQICKEVIAMMLKNMVLSHSLFPHVEKRMSSVFKKQFLAMEKEIQEEYERKKVALTAESNLETRKKMEAQHQRERNANEEAEELMKKMNEKPAVEYRSLLDRLHRLEQDHLKRFLLVKQEEHFANAYRQLAVTQRKELHNIFFTQLTNATFKGELKLEAAKTLMEDYSKIQGDIEELMDFLQANKKYHLNRRFAYRLYLISNIQLRNSQASALINAAATQISSLINKMERAGHLPESHLEVLLDRAEAEINSVKQKFNHDLKQEKQKLRQKLITKRRREMLEKMNQQKEQWKEQLSHGDPFKFTKEVTHYLNHWKSLLSDHTIDFEELIEKLDNEATEELKELLFSLTEKTVEELKRFQYGVFVQELVKLSVPKMFLLEAVEEHKKEMVVKRGQLEREECDKSTTAEELLQLTRQNLSQELEASLLEQKKLRSWEQSVFMQLLSLPLSLSEEELLRMRQELHCCFSQVDSSLAWPKIRARTLLQDFEVEWRDTELLKVDQNLALTNKQLHSKAGSRNRNKIDILKKSLQDKILIYEDSVKGENLDKVKDQLLLEKEGQLCNLENKLGEYITSLAFQKTLKKSKILELYTAVISVQALLFEQLSTSKTLSKLECIQILEAHSPEIEELDRKLEYEVLRKESAQQHLMSRQRWTLDGLGLPSEALEMDVDRQMTALLKQAMNKCRQFINLHQQSLRDEQWNCAVLEDLLENIEMDAFLALYSQELRLAGYLATLTRVPMGTLHRILNMLLPSSSQSEVLSVLDSISKYSGDIAESDSNADESGSCKKRKNQELWQAVENKVRQDLISGSLEDIPSLNKRKDSVIKKKQLAFLEKASFMHLECLPTCLPMERSDPPDPLSTAAAEAIELLDTGEKVFLFRELSVPAHPWHNSPRKKKKNFLNSKKAARANMDL